ncbi:MAG TPA: hypothetical protein VEG31_00580 [Thermoproteota archaeon]|nr:hypothetical protein [Thermoproteota archaeon]
MADQPAAPAHVTAVSRYEFLVADNFDALKWPEVCCTCGTATDHTVDKRVEGEVAGYGRVKADIKNIPYCKECYAKTNPRGYLDLFLYLAASLAMALIVSITIALGYNLGIGFMILLAFAMLLLVPFGRGSARLFVRLHIMNDSLAEIEDQIQISLSEDKPGAVVIEIPNEKCADSFAKLNNVTEPKGREREPSSI